MSDATSGRPIQANKAYGVFVGLIDQFACQRIAGAINAAGRDGIGELHILFHSGGGSIGDGVFLYNLFRATSIEVTLYNAGSVASAATLAYLGAPKRSVTANATFMIHKTYLSPVGATYDRLQSAASVALLDDQRVEGILNQHLTLPPEKWDVHKVADLWLSAEDAVRCGLATEVADFAPPKGQQLFYLGPQ